MKAIKVGTYKCLRPKCRHTWHPRNGALPTVCPKCKSPYWNRKPKVDVVSRFVRSSREV